MRNGNRLSPPKWWWQLMPFFITLECVLSWIIAKESIEMRIAVGSDHRGAELREKLIDFLRGLDQEVVDATENSSAFDDYPDVAEAVARKVSSKEVDRGILICGTGLGMCIAANKIPGVRAAPCFDDLSAEISRRHNDLNVLCLSGDMIAEKLADRIVEIWLKTPFEGGRHARRLHKIASFENQHNGHTK
jgi:ribose 5-phosphate isomerase B